MPLTLAQMLALFPDNTAGDISAQDGRDVITAIVRGQRAPYSVDNAADVWWEGDSGDFTTVTTSGSQTVTEADGQLSVVFASQSASDLNGFMKAHTFSVGDTFCVRVRSMGSTANFPMASITFSDGTTSTSNTVSLIAYVGSSAAQLVMWNGTFTAQNLSTNVISAQQLNPWNNGVVLRLEYDAADTFLGSWSPDGISWSATTSMSFSMTPTHFGVGWTRWGGAGEVIANFGPICKVA